MPSLRAAVIVPVIAMAALAAPAAAVEYEIEPQAPLNGSITVSPTRFDFGDVEAGRAYSATLTIRNRTRFTATFQIRSVGVRGPDDERKTIEIIDDEDPDAAQTARDWVTAEVTSITLEPRQLADLQVRVDVPRTVSPGGHYAAVTIQPRPRRARAGATQFLLEQNIAVPVLVVAPGKKDRSFVVDDVQAASYVHSRNEYVLSNALHNTGNMHMYAEGTVRVRSIFGNEVARFPIRSRLMLPGGRTRAEVTWKRPPWVGLFRVTTALRPLEAKSPVERNSRWLVTLPLHPAWLAGIAVSVVVALVALRRARRPARGASDSYDEYVAGAEHEVPDE